MSANKVSQDHSERLQMMLSACPLIPVITIHKPEQAIPLGRALLAGGIRILEITLRTSYGLEAIRELRASLPEAWIGAGTVVDEDQYEEADVAGAQFVVSPGLTESLLDCGLAAEAPLLPGISTLSELMLGYQRGYREFKFFPAEIAGGIPALKAFAGPFADVRFCPTGGITMESAASYLALKNVAAVGGTWLTPQDAVDAGDWDRITEIARKSLAIHGRT